jgi:hypothetical protein
MWSLVLGSLSHVVVIGNFIPVIVILPRQFAMVTNNSSKTEAGLVVIADEIFLTGTMIGTA